VVSFKGSVCAVVAGADEELNSIKLRTSVFKIR